MINEHNEIDSEVTEQPRPRKRREMSRRQFLNYTLGGTGAFLISLPLIPNLRFAVDALLQPKQSAEFVKVAKVEDITQEPQDFRFQVHQVDGWYESDQELVAWIARDEKGTIFALSPICKHLGCTIRWNTEENHPNEYFCPCHGARYTPKGRQLAVSRLPLDEYEVEIRDGWVYLGAIKPNEISKEA